MTPLELAKALYEAEQACTASLRGQVAFVYSLLAALSVSVFYFIEKPQFQFETHAPLFIGSILTLALIAISGIIVVVSDLRYPTKYIARADDLERYRKGLGDHDPELGDENFSEFLISSFAAAASENAKRNRFRGNLLFQAKLWVLVAVVPFLFTVGYYLYSLICD